jgi:hypothetical protein
LPAAATSHKLSKHSRAADLLGIFDQQHRRLSDHDKRKSEEIMNRISAKQKRHTGKLHSLGVCSVLFELHEVPLS